MSAESGALEPGPGTRLDLGRPGSYGVLRFSASAGDLVELTLVDQVGSSGQTSLIAPDGSAFSTGSGAGRDVFSASTSGVYELWTAPGTSPDAYETWTIRRSG